MDPDFAGEGLVGLQFRPSIAASLVHFVIALPGEVHAAGRVAAVELSSDTSEGELASAVAIEEDVGVAHQVEELGIP